MQSTAQVPNSTANLTGYMYTKGSTFIHLRDTQSIFSGKTNFPEYECTDPQGGTFWVEFYTSAGNHDGKGAVSN